MTTQTQATPPSFFSLSPANPFPTLAQLRVHGAVAPISAWAGNGFGKTWLVTQWAEAVQVLKDKRFTVDATLINPKAGAFGQMGGSTATESNFFGGRSMISVDGVDHARLRGLVSKAFTPRYIEALRPKIQQIADDLLDQVQGQGTMDLVSGYAYPLPINVISDMLGVPAARREDLRQWSASMASGGSGRDLRAFAAYIMELVATKRRQPQDDLISNLIHLEAADDALDEQELLSMVGLLIFAGHETTSNLISIGMLTLFDHPTVLAQLKADLSLVPAAVEELLRINGPVLSPAPRFALETMELGGVTVNRGDMLFVSLGSANHDETVFTDPTELNIARDLSRHIAFGQGIHFCLGAPLARLEGEIAFTTLLQRMPNLRISVSRDSITWRGSVNLRGLTALPVAF